MTVKYFSTTSLAKEMKIPAKEAFKLLMESGLINRVENNWILTEKEKGGLVRKHPQYGSYIVWPENLKDDSVFKVKEDSKSLFTATALAKHFVRDTGHIMLKLNSAQTFT